MTKQGMETFMKAYNKISNVEVPSEKTKQTYVDNVAKSYESFYGSGRFCID